MGSNSSVTFPGVQTGSDRLQLADLARAIWEEHYIPIIGEDQVAYMLETLQSPAAIADQIQAGRQYHFIQLAGNAAGYFAYDPLDWGLFLSKLYVMKPFRGKGLARKVVSWLWAHEAPDLLRLTVNRENKASIRAYQSMGFHITETVLQDIGCGFVMDDYVMEARRQR